MQSDDLCSDSFETKAGDSRFSFKLLLFILLLAGASTAKAGLFCSGAPFNGVVDGSEIGGAYAGTIADPFPTQITIDTDCTFQNFTASNPLTATLNFQTNDPSVYLITFNNVIFTGNMACANIDHRIWFVNGSDYGSNKNCQDLFIPVEAIQKQNPAGVTSVGIGDPYTYTLTIPVLFDPVTQTYINNAGSANDLHSLTIRDDLNATGADLTLVGTPTVVWDDGLNTPVPHTFIPNSGNVDANDDYVLPGTAGSLKFIIDPSVIIPAGDQILINVTVAADPSNAPGTQIVNTAKWTFGRLIEIDGVPTFFDPLPGENGITEPLTVSAPNLLVSKSSPDSIINVGSTATFTIDVRNAGGADAWDVTILDLLADDAPAPGAGMCDTDPSLTLTAQVFAIDGVTPVSGVLVDGIDFTTNYDNAACEFTLVTQSADSVIGPDERLIITYQSQLDAGALPPAGDGVNLINIAGATEWFSADAGIARDQVVNVINPVDQGTTGIDDFQDSHTITTALTGYVFEKTVANVTTGESPATTAAPGDTLRYQLRMFNFDETIENISFSDNLDGGVFDLTSFNMVSPLPAGATFTYNSGSGLLQIIGDPDPANLDLVPPLEFIVEFEITLDAGLANGTPVSNQANFTVDAASSIANSSSDDPSINGAYIPGTTPGVPDPTVIFIQQAGVPAKTNPAQTEYTIGEQFTYRITVPAVTVNRPLYDVRITDVLEDMLPDGVDLSLVSAVDVNGVWTLSNAGTATSPVIVDAITGIDIPANGQIEVDLTVELLNSLDNQSGDQFSNTASYTYNRVNGDAASEISGGAASAANMSVAEPAIIAITKVADNTAPTAGEVVRYTVTLEAGGAANSADVFDVTLTDALDLGLVYVGNPTVSIGAGVAADNVIAAPDITGDGVTTAQMLVWGPGSTTASDIDIEAGTIVTIEYDVRVDTSVLAGQVLNNIAVAEWTSLDGAPNFERTGVDGIGGLNDYVTSQVVETLNIADINATISKVRSSDTFNDDGNVRVGDTVDYTLTVTMPEGTLGNVRLIDTLPEGLDFDSIISINGDLVADYAAVAPFSHTDITPADIVEVADVPTAGQSRVTWNLGDLTNLPVDDTANDFVIVYRARVLNNVLDPLDTNIQLNNTVELRYDTAVTTIINSDIDTAINVFQPQLSLTKSVTTQFIDTVVEADEVITYTVDIENTGTSPAYDLVLEDTIPVGLRDGTATVSIVSSDLNPPAGYAPLAPVYDSVTGLATWNFDTGAADDYTIPPNGILRVVYTVQADNPVDPGLTMTNAATATLYYSFDDEAVPVNSVVGDRQVYGPSNTATTTLTTSPGAPDKLNPLDPNVTIGQEFTYTITIPEAAQPTPLYDVRVLDDLTAITADVTLVSIDNLSGGTWVPQNTNGPGNNLVIEDTVTGIDIPANQQIQIGITLRLDNTAGNNAAETFTNTAAYTYNAIDNDDLSQLAGGSDTTLVMTKTEPVLSAPLVGNVKTVTNATPGKAPADLITGGDILEYVVTVRNSGSSTAFDVNVVDTLPAELLYFTAPGFITTATINAATVAGFDDTPAGAPAGPLIWGNGNGDGTLDIPVGGELVLTYYAQVQVSAAATFNNEVWFDWSSLDGANAFERDGAGCPVTAGVDDYCFGPASVISNIVDNNSLSKVIIDDSWDDGGVLSTALDKTLRVGDTVSYQLTLSLGEGTLNGVTVTDVLPSGMEINSFTVTPASAAGDFTYLLAAQPAPGDTGTISWDFGTIVNTPSGDGTPIDDLVIEYTATVLPDAGIVQAATGNLINDAVLAYLDGSGVTVVDPARLEAADTLILRQPVMSAVTKTGNGLTRDNAGVALSVNVATDTMDFQLQSCNAAAPSAPAYSVLMTDVLATQLDESSITVPVVTINGVVATAGVDYIYTPPGGRGGTLQFELLTAVNSGQCVTIDYSVGFYTDFGPNEVWNNRVTVDEYWSLPQVILPGSGQRYTPVDFAEFYMTNQVIPQPLSKVVAAPVSGEITVGETAVYTITVPDVPVNAVLNNVVVSDTLDAVLEYQGATAVDGGGLPVTMVDNTVGQDVALAIASIPAGEQVIITLTTRLANNASSDAGTSFTNTASYTYTGIGAPIPGSTSGALLIVEPLTDITKGVIPNTPPSAGDILTYSLTFTASGGVPGDNFSNAYDLRIDDSLSLGLAYVLNSATVDAGTINNPVVTGDGINAAQTLLWRLEDGTADIDIAENTTVTVTYDVVVLDNILPGQELTNSASSQWTGIDQVIGDPVNPDERNGSNFDGSGAVENDYFNGPVITTLTVPDNTALTKTRISDTFDVTDDVRVGDVITYTLAVSLDEGSHSQLVLTDQLPQGMQFEGVVNVNGETVAPYAAAAPFSHTAIAAPVITGDALAGTTITWSLGDITNESLDNTANDFIIVYQARPINNDYFELNPTATLQNDASLDYQLLVGGVLQAAPTILVSETVNLRQPDLGVAKNSVPPDGSVVDAGQSIAFTVLVTNNGDAPAYDTVVEDVLSAGFRQTTPVTTSIYLASAPGSPLPLLQPAYDSNTGIAIWDFDNNIENTYTIPVGDDLVIEYTAQTDNDLGPGVTLNNSVTVDRYYSLDDEEADTDVNDREEYVPVDPPVVVSFTTPVPAALLKQAPSDLGGATEVAIGETVTYQITIPSAPINVALHDVRIIDDISQLATAAGGADGAVLEFVSATASTVLGGTNFVVTDTDPDPNILVLEDVVTGIDIPANDQVIVNVTVRVSDDAFNVAGNTFNNTADYSYNQLPDGSGVDQLVVSLVSSGDMTIIEPDLTVVKTGPPLMQNGFPDYFTIQVTNSGGATAWNMTIDDALPNQEPALGGMCDITPILNPGVDGNTGVTIDATTLTLNTDYSVSFVSGAPTCTLSITMLNDTAALAPGSTMTIVYAAELDTDTPPGLSLTNVAGVTSWFSLSGSNGRNDTIILTADGTPLDNTDEQDAWTVTTQVPVITVEKSVQVVLNPGTGSETLIAGDTANAGDMLEYTVTINNVDTVPFNNFYFSDEIDALNASGSFVPGSLTVTDAGGGNDLSVSTGGTAGTGQVLIEGLNLDALGGLNDSITITFRLQLLPVMNSGTVVLNQAAIHEDIDVSSSGFVVRSDSDDPALLGFEDPTVTTIISAPVLQVQKISADITGDPAVLLAGDSLRYTLTVQNIGNENLVNALLSDQIPANTTYVAGTTTLNGVAVTDPSTGVSALEAGMPINSSDTTTAGLVNADPTGSLAATITFEVTVNASVIDGTVIANQGFVTGDGSGNSGALPQQPSDDPDTATVDDPTLDVVGNSPLLDVTKTVVLQDDADFSGFVSAGDTLRYTITTTNIGTAAATGVVLSDDINALNIPASLDPATLNIISVTAGADTSNTDFVNGILDVRMATLDDAGGSDTLVVVFEAQVNGSVAPGDVISNQGFVSSNETIPEPSDADGIDANGDQPTVIVVGNTQQLSITKQVLVVGGGAAELGGTLEYVIRVTNIGLVDATNVVITDDLDLASMSYVNNSGLLDGLSAGVSFASPTVTANVGDLVIGAVTELRFRVTLSNSLFVGDTVTNTAEVNWGVALPPAFASVSIDIGGSPGSANLNGLVWHDTNFDNVADSNEALLQGWTIELYRNSTLLASTLSDSSGVYQFSGVVANNTPGFPVGVPYEIRFVAPGAVATAATMGDGSSVNSNTVTPFTDGPQRIADILATSGSSVTNLNMPRQPNGIVYDSVLRVPVAGVQLTMINQTRSNQVVPDVCFDDRVQQGQVTLADGYYKFDLNFSDTLCTPGDEYVIQVQPPANGYVGTTSAIIPPLVPVTGAALDVPNCPTMTADQVPTTTQHCETSASEAPPVPSIAPGDIGTEYYLKFLFDNADFTGQVFNNHIPVDPELEAALAISKVSGMQNVTRSQLVPYTITINNTLPVPLYDLNIIDNFPAGFKYVAGSSRVDGAEIEPIAIGNQLTWQNQTVGVNTRRVIKLLLVVGAGVSEGEYVNTAQVINSRTNEPFSGIASATVQVIPDPTFDCSDVIGKVFDDKNNNAYQDDGETGLAGVQVATARGLRVTTDAHGRFHITCAIVPNETRGSNFIMKVDDRTLPSGYRITTENPRVQRATRGKMLKFNFGAAIHRVVRLDLANGVFEKGSTELRPQWKSRIDMLITELQKDASILRLSYLGENESEADVDDRLDAIEELISERWQELDCCYKLMIEKEVFWRKGHPSSRTEFE